MLPQSQTVASCTENELFLISSGWWDDNDTASSLNLKEQKQERRVVLILAWEFSCSERSLLLTDTFAAIIDDTTAALLNKHASLWRESRLYIISVFQERRWDYERRQAGNPDEDNEVSCSWHVKTKGSPPPHPPTLTLIHLTSVWICNNSLEPAALQRRVFVFN